MITIEQVEPNMTVKADGRIQLLVWHRCEDILPAPVPEDISFSEWIKRGLHRPYLCQMKAGHLALFEWCNGWNCNPGYREGENFNVVAWAEAEIPFPEEVEP